MRLIVSFAGSVLLLWVLGSVFWAPHQVVSTTPYPVDIDPSSRGLPFDNIQIQSTGVVLEGWWIPAEQPRAELIFVHGAGSNRISQYIGSLDFYRTLHDLQVSVITMDLRNHGNSPTTDGLLHMGAAEWPDVMAAARWLDRHQPSQLPRVVLGASMGGSTVIHAVTNGLKVDAIILLDPQLDILDSMQYGGQITTGLPAPLFSLAVLTAIYRYDLPHGADSPLNLGKALTQPILLMQDWDDPITRSPYADELAASNPRVTLQKVPPVDIDDACLDGKEAWGSHVAAHPCHPDWTKQTVAQFLDTVLE